MSGEMGGEESNVDGGTVEVGEVGGIMIIEGGSW